MQKLAKQDLQELAETESSFTTLAKELLIKLQPKNEALSSLWKVWLEDQNEEALIQAGIDSDPDAYSLTDAEWAAVQPLVKIGRPKAEITKERITIRLSRDVLSSFRATGQGWQTRVDGALRQYILEHPFSEA